MVTDLVVAGANRLCIGIAPSAQALQRSKAVPGKLRGPFVRGIGILPMGHRLEADATGAGSAGALACQSWRPRQDSSLP